MRRFYVINSEVKHKKRQTNTKKLLKIPGVPRNSTGCGLSLTLDLNFNFLFVPNVRHDFCSDFLSFIFV